MTVKLTKEEFFQENHRITEGLNQLQELNKYHPGCYLISMLTISAQQFIMNGLDEEAFMGFTHRIFSMIKEMDIQNLYHQNLYHALNKEDQQ